jgi:aldose 1-epimerase
MRNKKQLFFLTAAALALAACGGPQPAPGAKMIEKKSFGKTAAGQAVDLYVLTNKNGMEADIITYGGIVARLLAPDRSGKMADVVLGFDTLDNYLKRHPYFGALIGRYGNRIGKAHFFLNGEEYKLAANNGPNTLHGGNVGFNMKVWQAREVPGAEPRIELTYTSPDMEEGFPGALKAAVTYTLTNDNELKIDYRATTDKDTVVNLTNHSYFNLAGQGEGDILAHRITLNSSRTTPVDKDLIPTGQLAPVDGTPFDFRTPHAIGERINAENEQIKFGGGYDHNWVLDRKGTGLEFAARVEEPTSGRVMEVWTTEPAVQFYTGNFLDGSFTGKGGKVYQKRYGLCLETQHYPDSPNQPAFPTTVLKPGAEYKTTTLYRFR